MLQIGLIQGKNPRELARHLTKLFGVQKSNAERLMRTELARVQTEAQRQSFERNGYEQYEFIALGNACDVCRAINGKHFDVKKMMPGENAPPMQPNCSCSTSAYMDREEFEKWLENQGRSGTITERTRILKINLQFFAEKDI
ncbi:MAG: minor capsid protein, partial [Lachnospiraceae bacterium]